MNKYVNVGNIIEQERQRRQVQIAKGIESEVLDHIEKAYNNEFEQSIEASNSNLERFSKDVENLNKAETEFLLSKIQRQINVDPGSQLLKSFRSIAISHIGDIEKAHKVGDMHPNGKWVWKEISPGKFDWRVAKKGAKGGSDTTSGGDKSVIETIKKIPDAEFKSIIKTLQKVNPDSVDASRYLEEEAMSDKELANFHACASHYKGDSNINKTTQQWCRKWEKLAKDEMDFRRDEKEEKS